MVRIEGITVEQIEQICELLGIEPSWRMTRCEHGCVRHEACALCESGYVYDTHPFARAYPASFGGDPLIGCTDDMVEAAYVPARYQSRVDLRESQVEAILR
jgi:hypothetical protein